jgi:hypothetical protein
MKKSNLLLSIALGALVLLSCSKKELDINMTNISDGNLTITVVDDANKGMAGLDVKLYDNYSEGILETKTTSTNGSVTFNKLLYGPYSISIDKVNLDSVKYNVDQPVQVIIGTTKEYTIQPSTYSGTATIRVRDGAYQPVAYINVGIFPFADYNNLNLYSFQDILGICIKTEVTDTMGNVVFEKVPLDEYGVFVYEDEQHADFESYAFRLNKKGDEAITTFNW